MQVWYRSDNDVGPMPCPQLPSVFNFVCKIRWRPSFSSTAAAGNFPLLLSGHLGYRYTMISCSSNTRGVSKPHSSGPAQLSCIGYQLIRDSTTASCAATPQQVLPKPKTPKRSVKTQASAEPKAATACYSFAWILPTPPITWTAKLTGLTFNCKLNKTIILNSNSINK